MTQIVLFFFKKKIIEEIVNSIITQILVDSV